METVTRLITTLGEFAAGELGLILPHEHVFVTLQVGEVDYPPEIQAQVVALMAPEIAKVQALGVTALVECSTIGVGRDVGMDLAVSRATGVPIVVATGVYREPWLPTWVAESSEQRLYELFRSELTDQVGSTGVRAAWLKVSAGDDGITANETKVLRAAARAGSDTGAVIGSHTIRGQVVTDQLAIIEEAGYSPQRFIWIHTQQEPDISLHLEIAARGAWISYDGIGTEPDDVVIDRILRLMEAGFGDQLLLSHDRGWYDPALPNGGEPRPYDYLSETFLPKLRATGFDEATIRTLTHDNPFRAFAR
jgi:phosphotriesterase-related protein